MEKQNKQVNAIKHKGKKFSPAFQRWRRSRGQSAGTDKLTFHYDTKHQLITIQKIEHNLAYMDYAMIFCL